MAIQQKVVQYGNYDSYLYIEYNFTVDETKRTWTLTTALKFQCGYYTMGPWGLYGYNSYLGNKTSTVALPETSPYGIVTIVNPGEEFSGSYNASGTAPEVNVSWGWGVNSEWGGYEFPEGTAILIGPSLSTPENVYTIHYNANGGIGTIHSQTNIKVGDSISIKSNSFTKTGYTFKGWTTNLDGTDDGHNWTNWSGTWQDWEGQYGITSYTLTLYARWQANQLEITYNGNGANTGSFQETQLSSLVQKITYRYGQNLPDGLPDYNNPSYLYFQKMGYRAKPSNEWNTNSDGTGISINQATPYTAQSLATALGISIDTENAKKTLYVNWEPWGVVRVYTDDGWKLAIPYVYTKNEDEDTGSWKQTFPYVYSGKWKECH